MSSDASTFNVRGAKYLKDKKKFPSSPFCYDLCATDVLKTPFKQQHIVRHLNVPDALKNAPDGAAPVDATFPELLAVHALLPGYEPKLLGKKVNDGVGYSLVMYYKISPALREELQKERSERAPAVRLLERFFVAGRAQADGGVPGAPPDTVLRNFKGIARVNNLKDARLGGTAKKLVGKYNGTPFMIRDTISYFGGDGYFEVDFDVHRFSYLAKKGLYACLERLSSMVWEFAFVLQGVTDDELPEQMLAGLTLCHIDLSVAAAFDVPAGVEPVPPSADDDVANNAGANEDDSVHPTGEDGNDDDDEKESAPTE